MPSRGKSAAASARLPTDLRGPVDVELARLVEAIPAESAFPGGSMYDIKWDGFRGVIVRDADTTRIWSRQRKDLTARFPDIVAAANDQLQPGTVVDGELVMVIADRLSFDALQQRNRVSPAKAHQLAAVRPASYVAFDLLAYGGVDLRTQRWATRRRRLTQLAEHWRLPLQVSPVTADIEEARQWFEVLPEAMGVEGLVVKGAATRYEPGYRGWSKVKRRDPADVIVGGVIGPIGRPEAVIAGRYRGADLVIVGRTVPLTADQSAELGGLLRPAARNHPWPDNISSHWGGSAGKRSLTRVRPELVAEVLADVAQEGGRWRHPLRLQRLRSDLTPSDVDQLD